MSAAATAMGRLYEKLYRFEKTLEAYRTALAIYQELGNDIGIGDALNDMAFVHDTQGQSTDAERVYKEALAHAEKAGDIEGSTCFKDLQPMELSDLPRGRVPGSPAH